MSHPIYLSSSSLPRMPEGSRNEWRSFFGHGAELEANAFFPLFWRALFSTSDIRYARFIDEYDIDDEASAVDREECIEDFGADATYPYLVIDKAAAVARLATRREAILGAVGERYRPIYASFEALIAQHFGTTSCCAPPACQMRPTPSHGCAPILGTSTVSTTARRSKA